MDKSLTIADLRKLIREVLEEAPNDLPSPMAMMKAALDKSAKAEKEQGVQVDPGGPTSIRGSNIAQSSKSPTIPANPATAPTERPPVDQRQTIPAGQSNAEKAMNQELKAKGLKTAPPVDPYRIPRDKSVGSSKSARVHKILSSKGVKADIDAIQQWIAGLDSIESLVKSDDDLAKDWMFQNGIT